MRLTYPGVVLALSLVVFGAQAAAAATAPSAPRTVEITPAQDSDGLIVSWQPPLSDGGSPILRYEVSRLGAQGWELLGSTTGQHYVDLQPTATTNRFAAAYQVIAVNAVGASLPSSSMAFIQLRSDDLSIVGDVTGAPHDADGCYVFQVDAFGGRAMFNGTCAILFFTSPAPEPYRTLARDVLLPVWVEIRDLLPRAEVFRGQ